ncbi:DMT family transporter [Hydrogenophaga sp. OTU3427]|uniref:DMT family transporter n=1 Tax=Hydrogenophaga sp. OTU3427 TaxID=3043856 RepID=UPI00313CD890
MSDSRPRLTPVTALLLTLPPLLWAGNAVVGRLVHDLVPPITLNFLRWTLAFVLLLPLAPWVWRADSGLWPHWRRFAVLGLLGVGCYNALQYLALQTSTPINVTLVAASMPLFMLLVGRLSFGATITRRALLGAALSLTGVLVVLSRGDLGQLLAIRLVPGDAWMLLATAIWAFYSWMLTQHKEPEAIRNDWAAFLLAQIGFGVVWSGLASAGEWLLPGAGATPRHIQWGWPLAAALVYVAVGPALVAFRCWGAGVQRAGPAVAAFFGNLSPVFAAIMSALVLGELPHAYHALAFVLIVAGIVVSSRR